jgi:PAS domain S-box-containing protein
METQPRTFSLRWKIVALVTATSFLVALTISVLNYQGVKSIAIEKALEKLAGETRLAALRVEAVFTELKNDAFVISRTPSILGLIYAARNSGIDPRDGSTQELWHKRLNTNFASVLKSRPHYTQIRYIGIENGGRELVRVNRHPNGKLESVSPENLQKKGNEAYFTTGLDIHPDSVYFSSVSYNREHGEIDLSLVPTIRVIVPVFDEYGRRFGMVVINANYRALMNLALKDIHSKADIYVSNHEGTYVRRDRQGKIHGIELAGSYSVRPPAFIRRYVFAAQAEGRFNAKDDIGYFHKETIAEAPHEAALTVFILTPEWSLLSGAHSLANKNAVMGLLLVLAASGVAALFGSYFTKPIASMTDSVTRYKEDATDVFDLPVGLRDEVGELARAFRDLMDKLSRSDAHSDKLSTQLDAFIASFVDGFIVINDQGEIEEANPALLDLFGYRREELIGRNVAVLMPEATRNRHDGYLAAYRETGERTYIGTSRDEVARRRDGTTFPIALSVSEVQLSDRRIFSAIIRDMTAIQEAQRDIRRYATELERSNQELDQFAYVASHDLKAPLRVIDNASRWLEEDLAEKLTDEDRENLRLLRNRVARMEKLLDDLLTYSRIGRGSDETFRETVDAASLIGDVMMLLPSSPSIHVEVPDDFGSIEVYRMPLQQVFYNLINNAIKHHDRDTIRIELECRLAGDQYMFTVRDDGPGVAPQFHDRVFEMFHTLKPRDQVEGSGMGLALVKKTVEHFGGTISVASEGRGAAFTFAWPCHKQQHEPSAKNTSGKAA